MKKWCFKNSGTREDFYEYFWRSRYEYFQGGGAKNKIKRNHFKNNFQTYLSTVILFIMLNELISNLNRHFEGEKISC